MEITAKDLEFVGVEHNELVERTYQALYDNKVSEEGSQKFVTEFLVNSILEFPNYSEKSNLLGAVNASQNILDGTAEYQNLYIGVAEKVLSDEEKRVLDRLKEIVDNNEYEQIIEEISKLEEEISRGSFDDKQLVTLYSATNLGRYSLQYWIENEEKWAALSGQSQNIQSVGRHVKDVVKGDIAGGVGGAAGAWVVNVVPGLGQAAYGSAIVGGAVAGSVYVAVVKILDWLW